MDISHMRQLMHELLITDACLCDTCEPNCERCLYCRVETTLATMQAPPEVQQLINALLVYMDHDECVCDPCNPPPPHCHGCMYCIAYSALIAIGHLKQEEAEEP